MAQIWMKDVMIMKESTIDIIKLFFSIILITLIVIFPYHVFAVGVIIFMLIPLIVDTTYGGKNQWYLLISFKRNLDIKNSIKLKNIFLGTGLNLVFSTRWGRYREFYECYYTLCEFPVFILHKCMNILLNFGNLKMCGSYCNRYYIKKTFRIAEWLLNVLN